MACMRQRGSNVVALVKNRLIELCVALVAGMALAHVLAASAFAATVTAPLTVSDDVTHFQMTKLDSSSHEYVSGAQMAIINKKTQEVVASWTTGEGAYELDKTLDVNTTYILREISAPDGYEKAADVEFYVNESENEGITIVSGTENGNAELTGSYTVALYDDQTTTEKVVDVTHTVPNGGTTTTTAGGGSQTSTTSKTTAPKTGDETPLWVGAAIAVAALVAAGLLQLAKRRKRE